jgi:predicted ester cyclase
LSSVCPFVCPFAALSGRAAPAIRASKAYTARHSGTLRVDIEQQFSAGDHVATVSTIRGVHEGDLMGSPPTGRAVAFAMITISRFEDGRIAEEWEIADTVALLAQIGALPEPAHN